MSEAKAARSIYKELGFPDAPEMLVKAQLATKIAKILRERGWSQQEAAKVMGLTQPKLSKMLRGEFRGVSEAKMMDSVVQLGCGATEKGDHIGRVEGGSGVAAERNERC